MRSRRKITLRGYDPNIVHCRSVLNIEGVATILPGDAEGVVTYLVNCESTAVRIRDKTVNRRLLRLSLASVADGHHCRRRVFFREVRETRSLRVDRRKV